MRQLMPAKRLSTDRAVTAVRAAAREPDGRCQLRKAKPAEATRYHEAHQNLATTKKCVRFSPRPSDLRRLLIFLQFVPDHAMNWPYPPSGTQRHFTLSH
jgi:hypothetical protein